MAGIGRGVDAAEIRHHQVSVAVDRGDHEADLIRMAREEDLERRRGVERCRDVSKLVDHHLVCLVLHVVVDLLLDRGLVPGNGTGGQKVVEEFPVHRASPAIGPRLGTVSRTMILQAPFYPTRVLSTIGCAAYRMLGMARVLKRYQRMWFSRMLYEEDDFDG